MPPRRTAAAAPKPLTLGFVGHGQLDARAVAAQLDDLLTEDTEVARLYIPVSQDAFTEEMKAVVDWCEEVEQPYIAVSTEDAAKDRVLKKVIAGASEDWDGGEDAAKTIVDLIKGSDEDPVENGLLVMFYDAETEADAELFEDAHGLEVVARDICAGLEVMSWDDDEPQPDEEREVEAEPEEEAPRARRGRGRAAASAAAEEEDEPAETVAGEGVSRASLEPLTLVELKRKLKEADPARFTTETLRGKKKPELIAMLLEPVDAPEEEGDEAQATIHPIPRADVGDEEVVEEPEPTDDRDAVFARLRANRERGEQLAAHLTASMRVIAAEGGSPEEVAERAAAALASSLMLFAEFIITEVRKPKSPGRPRKDGTEAQPRAQAAPAVEEPKAPARRPRRRTA